MYEDIEESVFTYPTNLVELSDLLEELFDKYEKMDKRKKKQTQDLVDKYNEGAKLYNKLYSELRGSDKKPVYKIIR